MTHSYGEKTEELAVPRGELREFTGKEKLAFLAFVAFSEVGGEGGSGLHLASSLHQ